MTAKHRVVENPRIPGDQPEQGIDGYGMEGKTLEEAILTLSNSLHYNFNKIFDHYITFISK